MVLEIVEIDIKPGQEAEFEAAAAKAPPFFKAAKGCMSFKLQRSVEYPTRYWLFVEWDTVDDHMIGFRNSDGFTQWRNLVGPYFDGAPRMEHAALTLHGF